MVGQSGDLISVVVPALLPEPDLDNAITSALRVPVVGRVFLVVDAASPACTLPPACGDERVQVLRADQAGLAYARNTGLRHARTSLVAFLDADDAYSAEGLVALAAKVGAAGADVGYGAWHYGPSRGTISPEGRDFGEDILTTLLHHNIAPIHSFLFRRKALQASGPFRPYWGCEDWDLLIRLALQGADFVWSDGVVATYNLAFTGMSSRAFRILRSARAVLESAFNDTRLPDHLGRLRAHCLSLQYLDASALLWLAEHTADARGVLENVPVDLPRLLADAATAQRLKWVFARARRLVSDPKANRSVADSFLRWAQG